MRLLALTTSVLILASGTAYAGDKDNTSMTKEERVEAFIEDMPDMNLIAAVLMSAEDRVSTSIKREKEGEDNCDIVQGAYKTIYETATDKDAEFTKVPDQDYNAEFAAVLREAVREDAED